MAEEDNDGVAYLRALRGPAAMPSAAAVAPAHDPLTTNVSEAAAAEARVEKRRSPRYKCEGSAEIREQGRDVRTWAAFKDISLHGCYVEATSTYPVGTILDLKLEAKGVRVHTKGIVRVTYPFLGMGVALTEMAQDDRERLTELLRAVSRPVVVMGPPSFPLVPHESLPHIADPATALRALVEFFEKHQILPREEFLRILRKSQQAKPRE